MDANSGVSQGTALVANTTNSGSTFMRMIKWYFTSKEGAMVLLVIILLFLMGVVVRGALDTVGGG